MAVVHQEVAAQGLGREVVHAAGPVGDVPQHHGLRGPAEVGEDVVDGKRVQQKALRELQCNALGPSLCRGERPNLCPITGYKGITGTSDG